MAAAELTISGDGDCLTVHARGRWTGEGAAALDGRLQSIDAKGYRRVRFDLATVEATSAGDTFSQAQGGAGSVGISVSLFSATATVGRTADGQPGMTTRASVGAPGNSRKRC